MEFLFDPNIAYLLIVSAVLLTLIAIIVPGTGIPEAGLVFCIMVAAFIVYQIGINLWAVTLLLLSIVPFFIALRVKTWRIPFLAATFLLLTVGSIFLFTGENGLSLVNPLLAVAVSLGSGGLIWFSADRTATIMQSKPVHDVDALIGQIGEARTDIHEEGSVQILGELWSARSETPIKAKNAVRILRRDGLILTVEEESK